MAARALVISILAFLFGTVAHADFVVSNEPTHDVTCGSGICTPTAKTANLNVSELTNMLAGGDTTLTSGNGDQTTPNIQIADAFSWARTSRLTLKAKKDIVVKAPVTAAGTGALTLNYNEGNVDGSLQFIGEGKIAFWDLNSNLAINGQGYTLVSDVHTLAADLNGNSGNG